MASSSAYEREPDPRDALDGPGDGAAASAEVSGGHRVIYVLRDRHCPDGFGVAG